MSKSQLRKIVKRSDRKRYKTVELLKKFGDINLTKHSTKHLLVSNGGLGNCVSREEIVELFRPYGLLEGVIMQERMPHSFVTFADVESATRALEAIEGHRLVHRASPEQVITLYVSYVDKVPAMTSRSDKSPEGLYLIRDFIDESTEGELQHLVRWQNTVFTENSQGSLKHRRVKHYGYEFNYDTNNVDRDRPLEEPMPELLTDIIEKIMKTGHVTCRPNQVTVNQYLPGQGIPPHVDTHSAFEDAIVSLSIGSLVSMDFTHPDGTHVAKVLPPRSLLVMTGEARYLWNHGITPRKNDVIPDTASNVGSEGMTLAPRGIRTSFTFRAVRGRPCNCNFPAKCDSQSGTDPGPETDTGEKPPSNPEVKKPLTEAEAIKLERSQVHQVYNEIAPHFSNTRYKPWPRVATFLNGLEKGSVVLDVGCGNGKYIGVNPGIHVVGCDRSSELITICAERGHEAFVCDGLEVPVESDTFDACISIAVIHHFSTKIRRLKALRELARLLRPGGLGLVYVWAMEQRKHNKKSKYLMKRNECSKGGADIEPSKGSNGSFENGVYSGPETDPTVNEGGLDLRAKLEEMNLSERAGRARSYSGKEKCRVGSGDPRNPVGDENRSPRNVGSFVGRDCVESYSSNFHHPVQATPNSNQTLATTSDPAFSRKAEEGTGRGVEKNGESSVVSNTRTESGAEGTLEAAIVRDCGQRPVDTPDDLSSGRASNLAVHVNKTEFKDQDLLVPWHLKSNHKQGTSDTGESVFYRFYHVFQEGELEEIVADVGGVSIEESYYDQGNWCVIFRKNQR